MPFCVKTDHKQIFPACTNHADQLEVIFIINFILDLHFLCPLESYVVHNWNYIIISAQTGLTEWKKWWCPIFFFEPQAATNQPGSGPAFWSRNPLDPMGEGVPSVTSTVTVTLHWHVHVHDVDVCFVTVSLWDSISTLRLLISPWCKFVCFLGCPMVWRLALGINFTLTLNTPLPSPERNARAFEQNFTDTF